MNDLIIAKKYTNKAKDCKSKGREFTLSFNEFKRVMMTKRCKYTGITLTIQTEREQISTDITIDRIDNSIGYVKGNVVACSYFYNQFKSTIENPDNFLTFKMLEKALLVQKKLLGGEL